MTVRVDVTHLEGLRALAESQNTTISTLINSAIETMLKNDGEASIRLTKEEIARVLPVVEAFGKPISLSLFLTIIQAQRAE